MVGTVIEKNILASDGHNYKVTVTYGNNAGIPAGADLEVSEILQEEGVSDTPTDFETYVAKTREALNLDSGVFLYIRFFDIKIVNESGEKVIISAPVDVKIELADAENYSKETIEDLKVVHFTDADELGDVVDNLEVASDAITFETEGFSVYAVVEGPSQAAIGWEKVGSVDDLNEAGFYIGPTREPLLQ